MSSQVPGSGKGQGVSAQTLAQEEEENPVERGGYSGERGESSSRRSRARSEDTDVSVEARNDHNGGVWPEPFLEALAKAVALEAARSGGALAVGPAVVNVFQVCCTWQAVSHSEMLWKALMHSVWDQNDRQTSESWRNRYIRLHRTASNFRHNRAKYTAIEYDVSSDSNSNGNGTACRCLALSPNHLAGGFFDGAVRIFCLSSKECIRTMKAGDPNRLGPLSQAIAGIVLHQDKVVFASFYGSIFVGSISRGDVRCAHPGNVRDDGTLVDFTGCDRWWVGLYAGISGHACHIWDAGTEELVFNGGDITDPDALRGWRMLTEQAERIGRVRIGSNGLLLLATRLKVAAFDLETQGIFFRVEEEADDEIIVESVDVNRDRVLVASNDGNARVRRMRTLENICALPFDGLGGADDNSSGSNNNNNSRKILGTLNTWMAFVCIDGVVHAWDADSGARLYRLVEQVGDVFDLVSDDEHVAGCAVDNGIHLWSFRP